MRHPAARGARRAGAILTGTTLAAATLAATTLGGCADPPPGAGTPPPRDDLVLLVTIDTLRGDALGAGGSPAARTPHLDRAARGGVQVRTAVAPSPLTLPSHATILSGRLPPEHGARDNGLFRVRDDVPLLPETFRDDGRETAAFLGAYPLAARFGLARGFGFYGDSLGTRGGNSSFAERPADAVVDEAAAWMAAARGARAFVWAHVFDPHAPYEPPVPWGRALGDAYRGEIAFTDREIGRLLRTARAHYRAVRVCVTADHGESLGEHGEDTHGIFVYEATTRVPLLFHGPGAPPRVEPAPVSLASVAATLCAWAGLPDAPFPAPVAMDAAGGDAAGEEDAGRSAAAEADGALFVETLYPMLRHGWAPLRGFRSTRWKVIRAPEPELYDLARDPGETRNLWEERAAEPDVAALVAALEDPRWAPVEPAAAPDPEVEEALMSLGYAGASSGTVDPGADLPDPKTRVRIERLLSRAGGALQAGALGAARSALSAALAVDPRNKETHLMLARLAAAQGDPARAAEYFDHCLTLPPAALDSQVYYERGRIQLDMGHYRNAEQDLARAVELDPLNVDARFNWGLVAYRAGIFSVAAERWKAALRLDPQHPPARRWLPDAERQARESGR